LAELVDRWCIATLLQRSLEGFKGLDPVMQLHIVGTDTAPENIRAKQELACVLEFLGISVVVEEEFSGVSGAGVVLVPPADVRGIESSSPVLVLDVNGTLRPELIGVERADGITPVGFIGMPLTQGQLGAALRAVRSQQVLRLTPQTRDLPASFAGVVARLPGDHQVLDSLRIAIAATVEQEGCTLIVGETGTGKRKIAQTIYECSAYADGPFVPVSCATFPESLLAIELFGCESGALPGSSSRRIGRIEMAEGGVLLIEDIEALSIQSQASLLAFLRSKRLERVGSTRGAVCELRVIASTTADLVALVEQGLFREDLFYALQGSVIAVPPLRDYVSALPSMLQEISNVFQTGALSAESWQVLEAYQWPGNVTELTNFANHMARLAGDGVIDVKDLPPHLFEENHTGAEVGVREDAGDEGMLLPVNGLDLKGYLAGLEKNLISQALEDTGFVVARAADRLHIRRTTLVEKMRKYGLQRG